MAPSCSAGPRSGSWHAFKLTLAFGCLVAASRTVQPERRRVDAVAQAGRLGPVVEHVPQMGAAAVTHHLGPVNEVAEVVHRLDRLERNRPDETGPAGAGIELVMA